MRKKLSFLFLFFCCWNWVSAQYNIKENSIWIFGYHTNLDFSSGSPVLSQSNIENANGFAVVSDTAGQLLFYTQGWEIWDRSGNVMPNGSDLFPVTGRLSPYTAVQGCVIVPVIGHPEQYYVFAQEATAQSPYSNGSDTAVSRLFYSVVDMSLNGGNGAVDPARRSIQLDSALGGPLVVVRGDACNMWVIAHSIDKPVFKAYEITAAGISPQPVVSQTGGLTTQYAYYLSHMKVSTDRKRIALGSQGRGSSGVGLELYDFDARTGQVSNAMTIDTRVGPGGIAFSPDNSKLYIATLSLPYYYLLLQYDVSRATAADILASRVAIDSPSQWLDLRLAPDGKIYHISTTKVIHCINDPNQSGAACNYTKNVIPFSTAPYTPSAGGGRFPAEFVRAPGITDPVFVKSLDTQICVGELRLEAPPGFADYTWNDGSTDTIRTVSASGTYWVTSRDACNIRVDSFVIGTRNIPRPTIKVQDRVLSTTLPYARYQWYRDGILQAGETNPTYTVTVNGGYSVKVWNEEGCSDSSNAFMVNNVGVASLQSGRAAVQVYPNPAHDVVHINTGIPVQVSITGPDGKLLLRTEQAGSVDISGLSDGVYLLSVADRNGVLLHREKLVRVSR